MHRVYTPAEHSTVPAGTKHLPPMTPRSLLPLLLAAVLLASAGWWVWKATQVQEPARLPAPAASSAPAAAAASAPAQAASGPAYPIHAEADKAPLAQEELAAAVEALLGRVSAATFVLLEEFPRRVVATVDNLGREHAPPLLWPTPPTPGRFTTELVGGTPVIAAGNAARYTPFVQFVETLDVGRTVDLYVRMYPLLQAAYRQLGYPGQNFNDRLVAVIDLLLAAPEPEGPVRLQLTQVKGPIPSERPWVRYEFEDPRLQSLAAGQKVMVRVGVANERRLKQRLAGFRKEIVARGQKR
jgi:hypothetical protein